MHWAVYVLFKGATTTCSYRCTAIVTLIQSGNVWLASRTLQEAAETLKFLAELGPIFLLHF
jgi:hypothetical protein